MENRLNSVTVKVRVRKLNNGGYEEMCKVIKEPIFRENELIWANDKRLLLANVPYPIIKIIKSFNEYYNNIFNDVNAYNHLIFPRREYLIPVKGHDDYSYDFECITIDNAELFSMKHPELFQWLYKDKDGRFIIGIVPIIKHGSYYDESSYPNHKKVADKLNDPQHYVLTFIIK